MALATLESDTALASATAAAAGAAAADHAAPAGFAPEEWALRVQLAGVYRVFALLGWSELIYNHITVRVPGPQKYFLINPFGLHYNEVTASNLVKVDLDGNIIGRADHPVNPAGFVVHSTIHRALPDAHCVMHTHTTAGLAVACSAAGLQDTNFYSAQLYGRVAYHDFEGITVHADEGPRLLRNLGDKPLLILRNHGLLALGSTIAQAFALLWTLNRACEIQLATASLGAALPIDAAVSRRASADSLQFSPTFGAGQDVLDAMIRQAQRVYPGFDQ